MGYGCIKGLPNCKRLFVSFSIIYCVVSGCETQTL